MEDIDTPLTTSLISSGSPILDSLEFTARRAGFTTQEIGRKWRRGEFGVSTHLGERKLAFIRDEVDAWIAERAALPDGVEVAQEVKQRRLEQAKRTANLLSLPVKHLTEARARW